MTGCPAAVHQTDGASTELSRIPDSLPRKLTNSLGEKIDGLLGQQHLLATRALNQQDSVLGQTSLFSSPVGYVAAIRRSDEECCTAVCDLAQKFRDSQSAAGRAVHTAGGNGSVEYRRQEDLARRDAHNHVFAGPRGANAIPVSQDVRNAPGELPHLRLGEIVVWMSGFGVKDGVVCCHEFGRVCSASGLARQQRTHRDRYKRAQMQQLLLTKNETQQVDLGKIIVDFSIVNRHGW